MKRTLHILISAGEHTCRESVDGDWCPFLTLSQFGQRGRCGMFGKDLPEVKADGTPADDFASSWLGRLPECKAAEGAT